MKKLKTAVPVKSCIGSGLKVVVIGILFLISCVKNEEESQPAFIFNPPDQPQVEAKERPDVIISEVAAVNERVKDRDNDDPDWIELYNRSSDSINLGQYYLSDDDDLLTRWRIPDTVIAPGAYLLIMASGKDYRTASPGGDSTDGKIKPYVWTWADGDDQENGESSIDSYELSEGDIRGRLDGRYVLSATLNLAENARLGWRTAVVHMGWEGWDSSRIADMSEYDRLLYKGYIEKDKKIVVRINQQGVVAHKGWKYELRGTGEQTGIYTIPLDKKSFLDMSKFYAIEITNSENYIGSVSFTCRGLYFITCRKYFHTNFSLNGNETLFLSDSAGIVIDSIKMLDLRAGYSLRRDNADSLHVTLTDQPTPGAENNTRGQEGLTSMPQIIPAGGFFPSGVNVKMLAVKNSTIRYTTDGSTPDTNSLVYSGPFDVDETAVIRARAYRDGQYGSVTRTASFFVNEQTTMAIISLAADSSWLFDPDTGIYMEGNNANGTFPYFGANFWEEKEVPVSVEMYDESKRKRFAHDAGLRIFGNWSRGNNQKSLSVHFRGMYGTSVLEETLFPQYPQLNEFRNFILRNNGSNSGQTGFRDVLMCSLVEDRKLDFQKYRPVVVYINGAYWGIYNLREKLNEDYLWTNYGLSEGEFDLLKGFGDITSGNRDTYNNLESYMRAHDMSDQQTFSYVTSQVDVVNFSTYMAAEMFYGNTDWPANNIKFWKTRSPESKWRWILYDTDFGFQGIEEIDVNMFDHCTNDVGEEYPNGPASTFMYRKLLENPTFKADFIAITQTLLNTNFETETVSDQIDYFKSIYGNEIDRHYDRWDFSGWDLKVERLYDFAQRRPNIFREQMKDFFELGEEYTLSLDAKNCSIRVSGMSLGEYPYTGTYFTGSPLTLEAIPEAGSEFVEWSDGNTQKKRIVSAEGPLELTAVCE